VDHRKYDVHYNGGWAVAQEAENCKENASNSTKDKSVTILAPQHHQMDADE
jgi:hypothetical protein